jgi:hypothetical protein
MVRQCLNEFAPPRQLNRYADSQSCVRTRSASQLFVGGMLDILWRIIVQPTISC